jgi:hypothetical protein
MVLTVSFVLSLVTGLVATIAGGNTNFHRLDASVGASGPHDFAVRVSTFRHARCTRPPHPVPDVRDDREPPLTWERDRPHRPLIWVGWEAKYFL